MTAYYNEWDAYPAQWIRNLVAAGHVAPGEVDERSIKEVQPNEVGDGQVHLFAGIAVWSYALRRAGYPDEFPVWTASCPCQPFSSAGRGKGTADARHLWPEAFRLIDARRPAVVVGEQVASKDGLAWLDLVFADMEGAGYACWAVDFCAASVGAPHIRQRLYWAAIRSGGLAHHHQQGLRQFGSSGLPGDSDAPCGHDADGRGEARGLGHSNGEHTGRNTGAGARSERGPELRPVSDEPRAPGAVGWVGDPERARLEGHAGHVDDGEEPRRLDALEARSVAAPGPTNGAWADVEWLPCRDGKLRPTQPGLFPLAHGAASRVGRLRAYGNGLVAPQAAEFLQALKPLVLPLLDVTAVGAAVNTALHLNVISFQTVFPAEWKAEGTVQALLKNGARVEVVKAGDEFEFVCDQTPFYGESGGQVGDSGGASGKGVKLTITDTQKPAGGLIVHHAKLITGSLAVHDKLTLEVDSVRRQKIRANHSATHLLHKALKVVLGDTVNQKGSVVSAELLRFDFSHYNPMTPQELDKVEDLVNGWVRENQEAQTRIMGIADARAAGAVALFGEKYGDQVRVVTVHSESTELCGGTHVKRSGDIGYFRIENETSVASGVRRIVALTGDTAVKAAREYGAQLVDRAEKADAASRKRIKDLERKLEEAAVRAASGTAKAAENVQEINGIKLVTQRIEPADANVFRQLWDNYKTKDGYVVGLGGTTADGKALVLVGVSQNLIGRVKAGDAIRVMAAEVGGKGGGKPEMAQAGGPDPSKIPEAFEKLISLVKSA